jgi:cytoskeletal protein CcmA (bactofilin family)
MSIFGKKDELDPTSGKSDIEAISSLIDKSMSVTGTITFKGKARIDGHIDGNIDGEHLILSETGRVNGNIRTTIFNCFGTIEGDIQASNVIARKSCSIHGRIEAASLTVEPGAAIDGEIKSAAKDLRQIADKTDTTPAAAAKTPILHKANV